MRNINDDAPRLAMLFEIVNDYGSDRWQVRVVNVGDDADNLLPNGNPAPVARGLPQGMHPHPLDGLYVYTWDVGYADSRHMMDATVEYLRGSHINLHRAETMAKTLKKVYACLDKAYTQDGRAAHMGQSVLRVARALNISEGMLRTGHGTYRAMPIAALSDHIGSRIATYINTGQAS